jgi:hypothetical protein
MQKKERKTRFNMSYLDMTGWRTSRNDATLAREFASTAFWRREIPEFRGTRRSSVSALA